MRRDPGDVTELTYWGRLVTYAIRAFRPVRAASAPVTYRSVTYVPVTSVPKGFVLLEAVIALFIIGLFAVGLLAATGAQVRGATKAETLLIARVLADDRMMALRMRGISELERLPDSLTAGRFPPPFDEYTWTAEVTPVPDETDLFSATVIVTARDEVLPMTSMIHRTRPGTVQGTI